ncbi:MAG: aminodeoxychorismate lyase [Ruaniaceae bacterium]|nr:aminodeoxychorismate lyase [Ruaniaceae bacterium]
MVLIVIDPISRTLARADPAEPLLTYDDAAATRGDGIFEAALVRHGTIVGRELHLDRFASSARLMDLPDVDRGLWNEALDSALAAQAASGDGGEDYCVRWILSRGPEHSGGNAIGWVETFAVRPDIVERRRDGMRVVTLSRGYQAGMAVEAPWLLIGAKTLSYAINLASSRFAKARRADEAIWTTTDGFVLEAPRSSVILAKGDELLTPDPTLGALHGTTQQLIFSAARENGWRCRYARIRSEDLYRADAIWLSSSIRILVPVTHVNNSQIAVAPEATARIMELFNSAI